MKQKTNLIRILTMNMALINQNWKNRWTAKTMRNKHTTTTNVSHYLHSLHSAETLLSIVWFRMRKLLHILRLFGKLDKMNGKMAKKKRTTNWWEKRLAWDREDNKKIEKQGNGHRCIVGCLNVKTAEMDWFASSYITDSVYKTANIKALFDFAHPKLRIWDMCCAFGTHSFWLYAKVVPWIYALFVLRLSGPSAPFSRAFSLVRSLALQFPFVSAFTLAMAMLYSYSELVFVHEIVCVYFDRMLTNLIQIVLNVDAKEINDAYLEFWHILNLSENYEYHCWYMWISVNSSIITARG